MKKIKFILFSAFITLFIMAFFACTDEVKNASKSKAAPKKITPATATAIPSQNKAKPVPAATAPVQNQVPTVNAATKAPAQSPSPTANAPATAPTMAPADVYNYNPAGKPDPFRPFIVVETAEKKAQVEKKPPPPSIFPLQRAETEMYRVVGIAGDQDHMVAIAEDTAKKFYPLFKGTRIGIREGKVIEIMADRVIVEEYENKKAKRIFLKLRKN